MDLAARRELNNGLGDSLTRAFELAATPAVFAGFGYLIDRLLGIVPVFTIAFFAIAVFGQLVLWWYRYDHKMSILEQELAAKRSAGSDASAPVAQPTARRVAVADGKLPSGITLDSDVVLPEGPKDARGDS